MGYAYRITKAAEGLEGYEGKGWASGSEEKRKALYEKLKTPVKSGCEKFRILCDDRNVQLQGWFVGDDHATGFEPLDHFMYNIGVTIIQYREQGEWKTL